MPFTVNEIHDGRTGGVRENGERWYTRTYRVYTAAALVGSGAVLADVQIPRRGDPYVTDTETDLAARVRELNAAQDQDDPRFWVVTVSYGTATPAGLDPAQQIEDPLARPVQFSYGTNKYDVPLEEDAEGNAVTNSADETFDPPPTKRTGRLVMRFQKNFADVAPETVRDFLYKTNSKTFFGFPEKTCLITDFTASTAIENGVQYWRVDIEVEVNPDTWNYYPLDMGYNYIDGNGKWTPFISEETGAMSAKPRLLNGEGEPLTSGLAVYLDYETYETADYDQLHLFG